MFLPIRTDSPLRTTPYMNWAIIVANIVCFAVQKISDQNSGGSFTSRYELYPNDPTLIAFFSYAFLHGGLMHLLGNMLFLFIFGNNVNDKMGHIGYAAFYLAGGVAGGIGYVLLPAGGQGPVLGASGAIAAVTGAYLVLLPYSSVTVFYILFFIGQFELPGFIFVLLFFAQDLIGLSGHPAGVAYSAHVFGTVFGFGVTFILLIAHLLPRDQFDVLALVSRWNKRRQYRDLVAKGYNPFDYTTRSGSRDGAPPEIPPPLDPQTQRIVDLRSQAAGAIAAHNLEKAASLYLELRSVDPTQVLARQAQLDVANQLAGQQQYAEAAEAYELFLKNYPKFEQIEQVDLMLGLIYARYLSRYDRAKECLIRATARLHGARELEMARSELSRIEPLQPR